jgi:hypothetical protein
MKNVLAILAVNLFVSVESQAAVQSVKCESVDYFNSSIGNVKTCYMQAQTSIDGKGFKISSLMNENVKAIDMDGDKKITFLPDSPADVFPTLEMYYSVNCSIKEITRENFRGLIKFRGERTADG